MTLVRAAGKLRSSEFVSFGRPPHPSLLPCTIGFSASSSLPLLQAMGSTEAGNVFSNPVPPGKNEIGSPGLPWGFEARIVDRHGVEMPDGESGEVLIRGAALIRGYYKDPEGNVGGSRLRRMATYGRPRLSGRRRLFLRCRKVQGISN